MLRLAIVALALVALSEAAKLTKQKRSFDHYEEPAYYKKPPAKKCYQCAYSPPKTYYDKKIVVEKVKYGGEQGGYDSYHGNQEEGHHGGYEKKSIIPVPYTVHGGWDKCLGPFDHHQAKEFGVDVWDCHSNCYVRKDKNGNIFRGCYKGEYGVDPHLFGCHHQGDALWCFCEGEKCNHGPAPGY